ncbi:MAG TPA: polyribonucleotide nucleotidyltransferase [Patescibacteria group bacterium]|nr:polyribonucleotide nucleotidyltransferase [Patescibacteria group bacterium]
MKHVKKETTWGGRPLSLEVGELAKQANASVLARYGDTVVLATVVSSDPPEGIDYFPLSVDYVEKLYAGGRISTSRFIKRETRPSEDAILSGRLIDRAIRPLFPKDYKDEVQLIVTVLSVDQQHDPSILAMIAASAAVAISDIPWNGPIAGARVGLSKEREFLTNPYNSELDQSDLDLVVASTKDAVVMVEAGAKEIDEQMMLKAVAYGHKNLLEPLQLIEELVKEVGREKHQYEVEKIEKDFEKKVSSRCEEEIKKVLFSKEETWHESTGQQIVKKLQEEFAEQVSNGAVSDIFEKTAKTVMKQAILKEKKRIDGRSFTEIRPISLRTGVLPRTHGSALFQRGDTQALSVVTLAGPSLEQKIEGMEKEETKRFMHHYNFSQNPFCTGETKRLAAPTRRDIGHGALVERALLPVIPDENDFPYTIRIVSEILSADASTSMAALCGSALGLMDAGVPIKRPVAGVAMGLLTEKDTFEVLTDMRAVEDFFGEMDLKVAGTELGITALQMDIKMSGVSEKILARAFDQAREARLSILEQFRKEIPEVRSHVSQYAPRISVLNIDPLKIGEVIGPGGRMIREITAKTGTVIDIDDDGKVMITGTLDEDVQKAVNWVKSLTQEVEVGETYQGEVKRIVPFGAFVEVLPGKEGLLHVSEMAEEFVKRPEDVVQIGDSIQVRVKNVDELGRINLTRRSQDSKQERQYQPRDAYSGPRSRRHR